MRRRRITYAILMLLVILLGLGTRTRSPLIPALIHEYAGDTLWALTAYLGIGFLAPRLPSRWVALAALVFSCAVEVSQLSHSPWLDQLRRTRLGGLVLGYGFLWSDLLCYATGIGLGLLIELGAKRLKWRALLIRT